MEGRRARVAAPLAVIPDDISRIISWNSWQCSVASQMTKRKYYIVQQVKWVGAN